MTKFKSSDRNEQPVIQLDDAALNAVIGGADTAYQAYLAAHSVGGWYMKDVFAKPVLGRYSA
jgi:hypothetical protein